jgi:peroxiredoxin Q/BCP
VILGASYDDVEANRRFAEKFSFPFELLSDVDKKLAKAYGAFDPAAPDHPRRAAFVIGKDGKILHAWEKVKAAEFPGEVAALLGAGGAKATA